MGDPSALVVARSSGEHALETRQSRIAIVNAQAQKTFTGLVIYAVLWAYHTRQFPQRPINLDKIESQLVFSYVWTFGYMLLAVSVRHPAR